MELDTEGRRGLGVEEGVGVRVWRGCDEAIVRNNGPCAGPLFQFFHRCCRTIAGLFYFWSTMKRWTTRASRVSFSFFMDQATAKFEQALPLVLLPVSSQLAALHTARTSQPPLPYTCSRCGSELAISTRVKRSTSNTHLLHTVCGVCGGSTSIVIDQLPAKGFPSWRKLKSQARPPHSRPIQSLHPTSDMKAEVHATVTSPPISRPTGVQHQPSQVTRPKKKPGLQELLQRNRDKAKNRTQKEETKQAGLSAFLSTL